MTPQQFSDYCVKHNICARCLGTGGLFGLQCPSCHGTGKQPGRGGESGKSNSAVSQSEDRPADAASLTAPAEAMCISSASNKEEKMHMPEEHSSITCEGDQHSELMKWAKGRRIAYRHSPMHGHSPMHEAHKEGNGEPDFLFMANRKVVFVEMKFGRHEKPSKKQQERQDYYRFCGVRGDTFWTIREAIYFVSEHLLRVDSQGQPMHEVNQEEKHTSFSDKLKEQI
jgi:hypothetical protein